MTVERRNEIFLIALEVFWGFGFAFIGNDILTALVYAQGGGPTFIALMIISINFLSNAPQLLVPYLEQHIRHPVRGALWSQVVIVAGWGAIAVGLWLQLGPARVLGVILVAHVVMGLGQAVNYPYYQKARLRLFPVKTRSKSYSTVIFAAQLAGMLGALACVPVMKAGGGPSLHNYTVGYVIALVMFALSTVCYLFLHDSTASIPASTPARPLRELFSEYAGLWRTDKTLRIFMACECCAWLGTTGTAFLPYCAIRRFGEDIAAPANFGRYMAALVTVPVVHYLVTRCRARAALQGYYYSLLAAFALMLLPLGRTWAMAAIALISVATIFRVNYLFHFVAGMSTDANRTRYFALCNAVAAPFILTCPLFGSWLLQVSGQNYNFPFGVAVVFEITGLVIATRFLPDPEPPTTEVGTIPRVTLKRLAN